MTEPTHRHQGLAAGGWSRLSLAEQLANVGSEVGRMRSWRDRDERLATAAFDRALELLELLCDAALGGAEYGATLEELDRYFLEFAILARNRR